MIESKRLPREMVLKQSRLEESRERQRIDRECHRLARDVRGIEGTVSDIRREQDRALREANALNREAKRLAEESFARTKISLMLDAVGAALSGGSSTVAKRVMGNAISTIGTLVGFTSLEQQITEKLSEARGKMDQFENFTGQLAHLEDGIARINKTRKELGCFR